MQNCRRSIDILIKKTDRMVWKISRKKAINSGINVTAVVVQKCIKVAFIQKVWFVFQISKSPKKIYSKLLSWAWNLNFLFTVIGWKFKFQVQNRDLEYFFFEIWRFEKHIKLYEKNPPLVSCQSLGDYFKSEQMHNGVKVVAFRFHDLFYNNFLYIFFIFPRLSALN